MFFSLPVGGSLSPFPRGTSSLSVTQEYLALRGGPRWFTRDSTCPMLLGIFQQKERRRFWLLDFHHLWCRIQLLRLILLPRLCLGGPFFSFDSHNPIAVTQWFRLFPFRSPLLRESLLLSFPLATEMFQFTRLPLPFLWIQKGVLPFGMRLPYSGIFGSMLVPNSPKRIAGLCALHRLWVPRSPP